MLKTDSCKENTYRIPFKDAFYRGWGMGSERGERREEKARAIKKTGILYDSLSVMQNKKILSSLKNVFIL